MDLIGCLDEVLCSSYPQKTAGRAWENSRANASAVVCLRACACWNAERGCGAGGEGSCCAAGLITSLFVLLPGLGAWTSWKL